MDMMTKIAELIAENMKALWPEAEGLPAADEIRGIYVMWDAEGIPGEWTLAYGDESIECGREGFMHEFVELPKGYTECTLTFSKLASSIFNAVVISSINIVEIDLSKGSASLT